MRDRLQATPVVGDSSVIDLRAMLHTLWRGRYIILAITTVAVLLGGYYAYAVATPLYRSEVVVMLNSRDQQVVNLDSVVGGLGRDSSVVNTEVEVLRSRDLLGKLVDQQDLISDPEFNGALNPPSALAQAKASVQSLLGMAPPPAGEATENGNQLTRQSVIDALRGAVSVRNVPDSLVFQVTVEAEDPRKATRLADALVEMYIDNQLEVKFEATEQAASWLSERVSELQTELEAAETRAQEFSTGIDLISPADLEGAERQLKDLRDRTADTQLRLDAAQARQAALAAARTPQEQADATRDARLEAMLDDLGQADVATRFELRFDALVQQADQEVARLENQVRVLSGSLSDFEARVQQQNTDLITLQQLTREAEASRLLYEHFLARLKETSAQQGIQQADSRVLSHAVIPVIPSEPRKSRILMLYGVLGLMAGAALVLFREAISDSFRDAQLLEATTGYAVVGEIPRIPPASARVY
ncbi:GumC family protein [Salipiger aestuarii]|uniref:GumC family protein n=1 Tax=Salipiger aestuarii TaxID=568098 RepID=UPI001CC28C5C|nr:GumC family protein [Salipiger aestuarii]